MKLRPTFNKLGNLKSAQNIHVKNSLGKTPEDLLHELAVQQSELFGISVAEEDLPEKAFENIGVTNGFENENKEPIHLAANTVGVAATDAGSSAAHVLSVKIPAGSAIGIDYTAAAVTAATASVSVASASSSAAAAGGGISWGWIGLGTLGAAAAAGGSKSSASTASTYTPTTTTSTTSTTGTSSSTITVLSGGNAYINSSESPLSSSYVYLTVTSSDSTETISSVTVTDSAGTSYSLSGSGSSWYYSNLYSYSYSTYAYTYSQRFVDGALSVVVRTSTYNSATYSYSYSTHAAVSLTKDTVAPSAPTVALTSDTGTSATDRITSNGSLTVTGTETGATVQYSTNGSTWTSSFTAVSGSNTVYVRQVDAAGNTSTSSAAFTFTLALDTPVVALLNDTGSVATDLVTNDGRLNVTGLETGATAQYSTNYSTYLSSLGLAYATSYATWTSTYTPVANTSNTVSVRQTNAAGLVSSVRAFTFTLDTTAPVAPTSVTLTSDTITQGGSASQGGTLAIGTSSDLITSNAALTVGGTEINSTVQYSSNGTTGWTSTFTAVAGSNTVYVRQVDLAGNSSPSAAAFTFRYYPIPTVVLTNDTGSSATDLITNNSALTVGSVAGATVEYSTNGTTWTATAPTAIVGSNTVYVRQTIGGFISDTSTGLTFTLDTSAAAPTVALSSDTGGSATDRVTSSGLLTVGGLETGAIVQYSLNNSTWASSFTAANGSNTVYVRQTDVAGNVSPSTAAYTFTLLSAPTVVLTSDTGTSATDNITSNAALTFSGAMAGATYEYSTNNATWTAGTGFTAVEGVNTIYARQTYTAGGFTTTSNSSTALTFTKDTTAPTVDFTYFVPVNNSSTTVGTGNVTSRVEVAYDRDWFAADLVAGQSYVFRLDSVAVGAYTGAGDVQLNLRNSVGTILQSNDDYNGLNSQINYTATTSGRYYLDAGHLGSGTGTYQLSSQIGSPTTIVSAPSTASATNFANEVVATTASTDMLVSSSTTSSFSSYTVDTSLLFLNETSVSMGSVTGTTFTASLSTAGVLTITPSAAGYGTVALTATDAAGNTTTIYQSVATTTATGTVTSGGTTAVNATATLYDAGTTTTNEILSIDAVNTNSVIKGGNGLDTIILNYATMGFAQIAGGNDTSLDVLRLSTNYPSLNLASFNNGGQQAISNFEVIDLVAGTGTNSVTLTAGDLFRMHSNQNDALSSTTMAVTINGDASDTAHILTNTGTSSTFTISGAANTFTATGASGTGYSKYTATYTDTAGAHLVEVLLQNGVVAAV